METISTEELKQKYDQGADMTVVEVLGPDSFSDYHLPGAVNVPRDDDFAENIQKQVPDKNQMVVVYCSNANCQASPQAAQQMDELGYTNVYDYEAGKQGWKAEGHLVE